MRYIQFKKKFTYFVVFSLADIKKEEPGFDSRRLNEWQNKGYIKKIRRGFYIFSDLDIDERVLYLIANKLYEPSYVSFEAALHRYNLIPEGVYSLTSISTKKTVSFDTFLGYFSYRKVKPELFFGYRLEKYRNQNYKIAEIEKAVLDYLYFHPEMSDEAALYEWRFNGEEFLAKVNMEKFQKYLEAFETKSLERRAKRFLKFLGANNAKS